MVFLKKIVKNPILDDPPKNHMDVHRHFYRFSKGTFEGPILKLSKTKAKITIKGSFEYEDVIQEVVGTSISEDTVEIKGVLLTGSDLSETITNLGLDWKLKKSTGQTKNYKADVASELKKKILLESIQTFRSSSYFLISFNINTNCKVTTKTRIPQPKGGKGEEEEENIEKRIQFCNGVIENTEKNNKVLIDLTMYDFESELPTQWKSIVIKNIYKISDIEIPKNIKDSGLLRIMSIRKGKLIRSIEIDGEVIEKQYTIVV